jgi:hypothetical protein
MARARRIRWSAVLLAALALPACRAGPLASIYRFQPRRVAVGTLFHYIKSNIDGTRPEQVALYIADTARVELYRYNPGTARANLLVATLDWRRFIARRIESWQVPAGAARRLFATMVYDTAGPAVEVSLPALGRGAERLPTDSLPFHVFGFDLTSLNLALPHLRHPAEPFSVRLLDAPLADSLTVLRDRGVVSIRYRGAELREGRPCRVYTVGGPGLDGREGRLWVDEESGYLADLEIPVPDSPGWTSFKLRLEGRETISAADWLAFQAAQLAAP